jgi:hypothetical protein
MLLFEVVSLLPTKTQTTAPKIDQHTEETNMNTTSRLLGTTATATVDDVMADIFTQQHHGTSYCDNMTMQEQRAAVHKEPLTAIDDSIISSIEARQQLDHYNYYFSLNY